MPGNTPAVSGPPGLALRAWAVVQGGSAVVVKSSGNVSSVTRSAAGQYALNLSPAMADANVVVELRGLVAPAVAAGGITQLFNGAPGTAAVTYGTACAGAAADPAYNHWVGVWG